MKVAVEPEQIGLLFPVMLAVGCVRIPTVEVALKEAGHVPSVIDSNVNNCGVVALSTETVAVPPVKVAEPDVPLIL